MSKQLKKQLALKGQEAAPSIDSTHLQRALFFASLIFLVSLIGGLMTQNLYLLAESLLIITLSWGIYRRNFASILFLSVYLIGAKIYQLFIFSDLPLWSKIVTLGLSLLLVREFYLGNKRTAKEEIPIKSFAGLFDLVFVLIISLTTFSLSTLAMELLK